MKGKYSVIFKGPLKDNKGATVVAAGTAYPETAIRARVDELSGRGRGRLHLVTTAHRHPLDARGPAGRRAERSVLPGAAHARSVRRPLFALALATAVFSIFLLALGKSPADFVFLVWKGAFGSLFSLQNTLQRAAPLLLTALCVAIPAQLGLVIIGGEGALVLGGLAATVMALPLNGFWPPLVQLAMALAGAAAGGLWIAITGFLRARRGLNETIVEPASCRISASRCSTISSKARCAIRRA